MAEETEFSLSSDVETLADAGGCSVIACGKAAMRRVCGCGCGSLNYVRDLAVDQPLLTVVITGVVGFVLSAVFRRRRR